MSGANSYGDGCMPQLGLRPFANAAWFKSGAVTSVERLAMGNIFPAIERDRLTRRDAATRIRVSLLRLVLNRQVKPAKF
ncbi:hypothetical protein Pla52o_44930 [Novipirellula galeiformis]|uniref:Uncharacterized protein n=1 Tax=Novipirellula galeiformis TaxID=2528004 RepID=A0A5C6C958_9BACT|nr:hypothetical protein Pla52o_44930 [Novipirellula galeiformis]